MLEKDKRCDYFLLLALSAWGLMLLCSSVELLSITLSLELASSQPFSSGIASGKKTETAAEAAIKYVFFGGMATVISLFGFSYILAARHTTYLHQLTEMSWAWSNSPMAVMGLTLFLSGLLFKTGLFSVSLLGA